MPLGETMNPCNGRCEAAIPYAGRCDECVYAKMEADIADSMHRERTQLEATRKLASGMAAFRRKRVYIAGPISKGDLAHNVNQATEAFIALAKAGFAPLCPHWSAYCKPAIFQGLEVWCQATTFGSTDMTHDDWLGIDLPWVDVCHAVLLLPGESKGADIEVAEAKRLGIPVFCSIPELIEGLK
jgi:hypothetical protein